MSYVNGLKLKPRRHPVQHKTGPEAIRELNTIVDQANARIAQALGQAGHFEAVAREAAAELERLQAALDETRQEAARLRADNEKLRRKLTVKAGRKKQRPGDDFGD